MAPGPIVYVVDESGLALDGPRDRGYAGESRLVNVIGAITDFKLLNLCLFDTYIYAGVSPELLTSIPSNSVIGLDHATFHQRGEALEAVEKAGQRVEFLPPDSPDLNPIGK